MNRFFFVTIYICKPVKKTVIRSNLGDGGLQFLTGEELKKREMGE